MRITIAEYSNIETACFVVISLRLRPKRPKGEKGALSLVSSFFILLITRVGFFLLHKPFWSVVFPIFVLGVFVGYLAILVVSVVSYIAFVAVKP